MRAIKNRSLLYLMVGVATSGTFLIREVGTGHAQPSQKTETGRWRIAPSDVNLANVAIFERQLMDDLPRGTKKEIVEAYLSELNIPHSYAGAEPIIDKFTFAAVIENIGFRFGFPASLAIRIQLNAAEEVDEIRFRIDYLAP